MADILFIIAPVNFMDGELFDSMDIVEKAGLTAVIASKTAGMKKGILGKTVNAEIALGEVNVNDYRAVVFIGGPGASMYFDDAAAFRIAKETANQNKIIAAICIAPAILANAGLLEGKRATIWDDESRVYSNMIKEKGAQYTGKDIEIDDHIITANGPESAKKFGSAIVKALKE